MEPDTPGQDEGDDLRADRDEWRRRAEVAEAVAAERLLRAEAAERALAAAEDALAHLRTAAPAPGRAQRAPGDDAGPAREPRPRSLLERWRRYTDTIN